MPFKTIFALMTGLALCAITPSVATAGPASTALGACFSRTTTEADQVVLVRWIFSAVSHHPGVADMAKVTPQEREEIDRKVGALTMRLLTEDCRAETAEAMRADGPEALETAFGSLGEKAMETLFQDPNVAEGLEGLTKNLDQEKLLRAFVGAPEKK
ncbi:hypothetical protein [Asticcacaulis sp. YBE204]|uniref:hypothetical protein n=1 Tax=Asticcacaulis sp. YBE204 TaxID=1282363 RepID=UPI0004169333|nr:hypothetical protein [Asticcacaulis sp. YBE204]